MIKLNNFLELYDNRIDKRKINFRLVVKSGKDNLGFSGFDEIGKTLQQYFKVVKFEVANVSLNDSLSDPVFKYEAQVFIYIDFVNKKRDYDFIMDCIWKSPKNKIFRFNGSDEVKE
jgi:hypothetical protein